MVKAKRKEFADVITTKDEDILEGYSNFKKSELKKIVVMLDGFISDCVELINTRNASKKPRKRKVKTPEQLVSKLNYCKNDEELGISSIAPEKIIACNQLWVYNIKTRKLGLLRGARRRRAVDPRLDD